MFMQPKAWWTSKTVWLNALTLLTLVLPAVIDADLVKNNPTLVAWLALGLVIANIVLRFVTSQALAALLLLVAAAIPASSSAQLQLCSPQKLAALRASLPATEDPRWQELFSDPATLFYTDTEIPAAYQHAPGGLIVGGAFVGVNAATMQTTFHSPRYNISGDAREAAKGAGFGGNGNIEFPWRTPGGTDFSEERTKTFKLMLLPKRADGTSWPVVWYQARLGGARTGMHTGYAWMFPRGTIFGEVLVLADSAGTLHTFEVRLRIRDVDFWDIEILRPFPTSADLLARLDELNLEDGGLKSQYEVTKRTLLDPLHPTQRGFAVTAGVDDLPEMSEEIAAQLLDTTPFKNSLGAKWKTGTNGVAAFAPYAKQDFSIVPKNYHGTFLGTDTDSCRKCHEHTLKHVDQFDRTRDWYGHIRGSDQIFTWHPIEPASIAYNGGTVPVRFRQAFVSAGMFARFNPAEHPAELYHQLSGDEQR